MEIVIIGGRNPDKEELYKLILELANSQGLSFEHVKKQVEVFQNSRPSMQNLADEYKKAMEALNDLVIETEKKDFPPSQTNPFYRQYNSKKYKK